MVCPFCHDEKIYHFSVISGTIQSPKIPENKYTVLKTQPILDQKKIRTYREVKGIYVKDLNTMPSVTFLVGINFIEVPTIDLYPGIDLLNPIYKDCINSMLGIIAKGNRIYVSARFVDIKTETEIGTIEYNHWKIYNGTYQQYTPLDDKFEVKDKQGDIVFSISYSSKVKPLVEITGYFVSPKSVFVINNVKQAPL